MHADYGPRGPSYPDERIEKATQMAVIIDGRVFSGSSVTIRNGVVTIDGVRQDGTVSGVVEIRVTEGTLARLDTDASVNCAEVRGDVTAGGSVSCGNIGGSVNAGGSVRASGTVARSINAGGSVRVGS